MSAEIVSFIIPSYNSAHTVKRCLDSIYALSLKPEEFEVIFIDDCSTDNTCEIVEAYSEPLPKGNGVQNLVLLKQPTNNRQGAARNRGVSVAKGEYICFVDSDDAVAEGIVDAIRMAKEKYTDMAALHLNNASEQGEIISEATRLSFTENIVFSGIELQSTHPWWFSGPVAYIYSKAFLDQTNYPFQEGVLYEDADFVMAHLFAAKTMIYSDKLGYIAYYRQDSTTRSTTYKNIADFILLGVRMLRLYEEICMKVKDNTDKDVQKYAEDVLDGACGNMYISAKRLIKLNSLSEVFAFYQRLDSMVSRKTIANDKRLRKYYWNIWTTICMRYRSIAIMILSLGIPMYHALKGIKDYKNKSK